MTWQEISRKAPGGAWPDEDLIESFRKRVEAGTHNMAQKHEDGVVKLMVQRKAEPEPWRYWSAPRTNNEFMKELRKR